MTQRSIITSGGSDHVYLVKMATKKVIDEFDYLQEFLVQYERTDIHGSVSLSEKWYHRTNVSFELRPDVIVLTGQLGTDKKGIMNVMSDKTIIIEAETDPRNLFKNIFKIETYKKIKKASINVIDKEPELKFILVCFEDAKIPKDYSPFDEVWLFPRQAE